MTRILAAKPTEVGPGERKMVAHNGHSIGLFNVNGDYVAVLNVCPHELAPICAGRVRGTTLPGKPGEFIWGREGEILACPWHGWEFDLRTGDCLTDARRLRQFPVEVDAQGVWLALP